MAETSIEIGKIVASDSHVRYTCQVFGAGEIERTPEPVDYAFGSFVRVPVRLGAATRADVAADVALLAPAFSYARGANGHVVSDISPLADSAPGEFVGDALVPFDDAAGAADKSWAVGIICDTLLVNPAFGTLGPRLSNDDQVALFSPDYVSERAVLVSILLLGTYGGLGAGVRARHGIPPVVPDLGAVVTTLPTSDLRAFHYFADGGSGSRPYLHMGYLPHAIAHESGLLPLAMLRAIEQLEALFPDRAGVLSIVKRNLAWRLKVESAG